MKFDHVDLVGTECEAVVASCGMTAAKILSSALWPIWNKTSEATKT